MELLLDGVLTEEPPYRTAYLDGLAHEPALVWRDTDEAARFAHVLDRLRTRGVPEDLKRPDAITTRLSRILGHRPLLAPSPDDLHAIHDALVAFQPRIEVAGDTVMRAMRAALDDRAAPAAG